jgi:hypothetical protein
MTANMSHKSRLTDTGKVYMECCELTDEMEDALASSPENKTKACNALASESQVKSTRPIETAHEEVGPYNNKPRNRSTYSGTGSLSSTTAFIEVVRVKQCFNLLIIL